MADVSTVYLGTHACEMKVWFKTGRTPQAFDGTENPYMELVTTANFLTLDADDGDSNPGSRGAAEWIVGGYASGLQVANGFTTPGTWKRYVTYAYKVKLHTISGSGDTDLAFIYSHHSAAPSANGNVRIIVTVKPATSKWSANLQVKNAGSWSSFGSISADQNLMTAFEWLALQIDRTGLYARILRNGAELLTWQYAGFPMVPTAHSPTPSPGGDSAKGSATIRCAASACVVYHADDTDLGPTTDDDYVSYPVADSTPSTWTQTGIPAACATEKYRALDDAEDAAEDGTADYLTDPGTAGNQDQMFVVHDQPGASADVKAVSMFIVAVGGFDDPASYKAVAVNGASTALATFFYGNRGYLAQFPTAPDGSAWTKALFNGTTFGLRAVSGRSISGLSMRGLGIATFGANLSRRGGDAKAAACPGGAASLVIPRRQSTLLRM
ncbi:MAG: hypothetical protein A2V88_12310 [Elusimicrobia bacterium RBG_16_66_12]|nr:MAG: hypothetical protein A2V88_12310 [Elusimicrobia bacterium RBG_16_66_12]